MKNLVLQIALGVFIGTLGALGVIELWHAFAATSVDAKKGGEPTVASPDAPGAEPSAGDESTPLSKNQPPPRPPVEDQSFDGEDDDETMDGQDEDVEELDGEDSAGDQ